MKTVLILATAVALLAMLVATAGYLLPADRTGHAARSVDAPPERVRAAILAVEHQPRWRSGLAAVERLPDGTWIETRTDGERIVFRKTEAQDDRLALQFESSRGYSGKWQATLRPVAGGRTAIEVLEHSTVRAPLGRILSRLFFAPDAFAARYLEELAAEVARQAGTMD